MVEIRVRMVGMGPAAPALPVWCLPPSLPRGFQLFWGCRSQVWAHLCCHCLPTSPGSPAAASTGHPIPPGWDLAWASLCQQDEPLGTLLLRMSGPG